MSTEKAATMEKDILYGPQHSLLPVLRGDYGGRRESNVAYDDSIELALALLILEGTGL